MPYAIHVYLTAPKSVVIAGSPDAQTRLLLDSRLIVEHSTPLMENATMSSRLLPRLYPMMRTCTCPPTAVVTSHAVLSVDVFSS